jgi:hypothetical protein
MFRGAEVFRRSAQCRLRLRLSAAPRRLGVGRSRWCPARLSLSILVQFVPCPTTGLRQRLSAQSGKQRFSCAHLDGLCFFNRGDSGNGFSVTCHHIIAPATDILQELQEFSICLRGRNDLFHCHAPSDRISRRETEERCFSLKNEWQHSRGGHAAGVGGHHNLVVPGGRSRIGCC